MAEAGPGPPRLVALDALRGAAICGMVAYHAAWDLSALGWPVPSPSTSPGWTMLGDAVAATFLLVSGIGLSLARPKGLAFGLRRIAVLAAAGLVVTAASFVVAPEAPILFGVLQCIAVADVLALPLLGRSVPLRLALAAAAAVAPTLARSAIGGDWPVSALDDWPGAALGLGTTLPRTLDFRPLLPWLALVLVGTVLGDRLATLSAEPRPWRWPRRSTVGLALLGRHSLVIYLLHQPLLYGALLAISLGSLTPTGGEDPFLRQCRADCEVTGAAPKLCAAACACTTARVAAEARSAAALRAKPEAGTGTPQLTPPRLDAIRRACGGPSG